MYVVKAFYTDGASSAEHESIPLAWAAFSHTVMLGLSTGKLIRAEVWDYPSPLEIASTLRARRCPLAVFDLVLIDELFSPSFRAMELTRNETV